MRPVRLPRFRGEHCRRRDFRRTSRLRRGRGDIFGAKDGQVIRILLKIPRIDGFALRMATFYAAFFAFSGIQMPYLPAWLEAKGLDAREIGIVLAAPMLIRVVVV